MNEWTNKVSRWIEWVHEWVHERIDEAVWERMNKGINEWIDKWANKRKRMNEWRKEGMNKWMNRMTERSYFVHRSPVMPRVLQKQTPSCWLHRSAWPPQSHSVNYNITQHRCQQSTYNYSRRRSSERLSPATEKLRTKVQHKTYILTVYVSTNWVQRVLNHLCVKFG